MRIDSARAVIKDTRLESASDGLILRGRVENRLAGHGPIPGHLHIELISPAGETLKNADVVYRKKGVKRRYAEFDVPIPIELMPGSTVRIIHFPTSGHNTRNGDSEWRDDNVLR